MSTQKKKSNIAVIAAVVIGFAIPSTAFAADSDDRGDTINRSSSAERPQPSPNEQTGMSWIEYFQCVRTLSGSLGSWTYAAQECEDQRPTDTPEVPEKASQQPQRSSSVDKTDR